MSAGAPRRRVFLVTRNFPPLRGGMERLNQHLAEELARQDDLTVFAPSGAGPHAAPVPTVEAPLSPLPLFLLVVAAKTLSHALGRRPGLVVAGSGLTAPIAWIAARLSGARCAVYLHGLDVIAPNPFYRAIWLPAVRRCDVVLANSENTAALARSRGVRPERIVVVHPGVELPAAPPPALIAGDSPLMLAVGRFTQRKGLAEFIEHSLPKIVARVPTARLVIVGGEAVNALAGRRGQTARILDAIGRSGMQGHVELRGHCTDEELAALYRSARVHVFPVLDLPGDVEGFGMVAIEAAAHGLPTVAFAVGGVPEAIRGGESGDLVAAGDHDAFATAVATRLEAPVLPATRESCRGFAQRFAWPEFGRKLRAALAEPRQ